MVSCHCPELALCVLYGSAILPALFYFNETTDMKKFIVLILMSILLGACAQEPVKPDNPFTAGKVSLTLVKGQTTKAEVAQAFGAPNIVTQEGDKKKNKETSTWIYQKNAQVARSKSKGVFATILLVSGSSNSASSSQSSRTMTLIIKFDKHDKVSDFKSMTTSF